MTEQENKGRELEKLSLRTLTEKYVELPLGTGEPDFPPKGDPAYAEYLKLYDWMNKSFAELYNRELTLEGVGTHLDEMEDYLLSLNSGDDTWLRFGVMRLRGCIWEVESSYWKTTSTRNYGNPDRQQKDLVNMKEALIKSDKFFMIAAILGGERDMTVSWAIADEFEKCGFTEEAEMIRENSVVEPGPGEYGRANAHLN